jgi:hypothetical protein
MDNVELRTKQIIIFLTVVLIRSKLILNDMKTILFTIVASFIFIHSLQGQDIIYTIQGEKDGQVTHLDSILVENLDNNTSFRVTSLPQQTTYEINLTKQGLVSVPEMYGDLSMQSFRLVKSIPGEVDILFSGRFIEKALLRLINLGGQLVYSHELSGIRHNEIINLQIPVAGIYLLNLSSNIGSVNFKIAGSLGNQHNTFQVRSQIPQTPVADHHAITMQVKSLKDYMSDFSFQFGDSLRVTAFLGGYYTHPLGARVFDSRSITFNMLKSLAESTGVSDRYNPVPENAYTILAYDTLAETTTLVLSTDTLRILPGDILTVDLDTMGLIQRVVRIREENDETIVETETAYMDELFVNQRFKLNTALMEPKTHLKSDATPQDIIEALTDENGFIRPVKIIYHDGQEYRKVKSVFDRGFEKEIRENIVSFHEDFSKTDLYGQAGQDVHFYIDEGHTMLHADAVFEFDFKYDGELTEDTKVKRGDLNFFEFYLDAEAGFQTKLALDMKKSLEKEDTDRIFRMKRATAKFMVPPSVPVWITFGCDVFSFYNFTADASLHANWGFESNHTLQAGGKYEKATNDFSPIYNYTPHNEIYPLNIEGEVNASARVEIYPRVDVRLYGFFGPFAEFAPYVQGHYNAKLQSQITFSGHETFLGWNSGIDLGLDLRVGTSLKFLLYSRDYGPININCFNLPLWASPVNLEMLTDIPSEITPGQEIELKVKVTDLLDLPVPLCVIYFDGDGDFSKQLPFTGSNGIATIVWTPGNADGDKNFIAYIYNAERVIIDQIAGSTSISGGNAEWPRDNETEIVEVFNPATGKTWMDRNLGASRAATSSTDAEAYGDLYQWGRAADGHQKRTSGTTSTLSNSDTPGHGNFILAPKISPWDWRSPQNR